MAGETWEEMRHFVMQILPGQIKELNENVGELKDSLTDLNTEFKTNMAVLLVKQKAFSIIAGGVWAIIMLLASHFLDKLG